MWLDSSLSSASGFFLAAPGKESSFGAAERTRNGKKKKKSWSLCLVVCIIVEATCVLKKQLRMQLHTQLVPKAHDPEFADGSERGDSSLYDLQN